MWDTAMGLMYLVGTAHYKQNGNQTYLLPFPAAHFLVFLINRFCLFESSFRLTLEISHIYIGQPAHPASLLESRDPD